MKMQTRFLIPALCIVAFPAQSMEIKTCGDQVILSGGITRNDYSRIVDVFDANPQLRIAVLRNSRGGDAKTGYRVGEFFRDRNITTYVSGYCQSSCSRFFLGGAQRFFTNDYPAHKTRVGFHSNYEDNGSIVPGAQGRLLQYLAKYSDGKIDEALAKRWVNLSNRKGFAYFFNAKALNRQDQVSILLCQGSEPKNERWSTCEKIPGHDAVSMGVATSFDLKRSCDADSLTDNSEKKTSRKKIQSADAENEDEQ